MKIILLQDIPKVGRKFDIKEVASGYALNFLFPRKQAKLATAKAVQEVKIQKEKHDKLMQLENKKLFEVVNKIKDTKVEILATANEEGKLFAGVGAKEIAKTISNQTGETLNPELIELDNSIKEIGESGVKIKIGDKIVKITVTIKSDK